jgi:hypothetical protein
MNCRIQTRYWIAFAATMVVILSCHNKKDCPGFSENLLAYIPQESRLVFYNGDGDSLVFNTGSYSKTEPRTLQRNVLSVGGTGSKPYCMSSCSMSSEMLSTEEPQLNYTINIDNEADTCDISLSFASSLPSNDYFFTRAEFSPTGRVFGDTIRLGNYTPTTDPRFSFIEIVYGRGITRIQDDLEGCEWVR